LLSPLSGSSAETLITGAPVFRTDFRLDMMLEGGLRKLVGAIGRRAPRLVNLAVMGAGSPHADELALAFDPTLDLRGRRAALDALLGGLERRAAQFGIGMTFLWNVTDRDSL
jgi:hypothetical protein